MVDRSPDYGSLKLIEQYNLGKKSRKGNCRDNARCESFFGKLKTEWVGPLRLSSPGGREAERLLLH